MSKVSPTVHANPDRKGSFPLVKPESFENVLIVVSNFTRVSFSKILPKFSRLVMTVIL